MTRLAIFCTATMEMGISGTQTNRATAAGRHSGARNANTVSGASTA